MIPSTFIQRGLPVVDPRPGPKPVSFAMTTLFTRQCVDVKSVCRDIVTAYT
jgi:hypothetical protein